MPEPEFDPLEGLTEDDKSYLDSHRNAFQRQAKAHAGDEERRKAAEEHMRATRQAAGLPADAPLPPRPPSSVAAQPVQPGRISIMVASSETKGGELKAAHDKYAPDWNSMKEIIAKHDGTWVVTRHEFSTGVADILGFFGKDGWERPADSEKEKFEVIVKNGRVFRTDPA
jgi:hypothetical protein